MSISTPFRTVPPCATLALVSALTLLFGVPAVARQGEEVGLSVALSRLPPQEVEVTLDRFFHRWQTFELPLAAVERQAREVGRLRLQLGAHTFDLLLEPVDLRTPDYTELWIGDDDQIQGVSSPVGTFRGRLVDDPEAVVRLLILPDILQGYIKSEEGWFFIDPLRKYSPGSTSSEVVFFRDDDVRSVGKSFCGSGPLHDLLQGLQAYSEPSLSSLAAAATTVYRAEVATEADFEFFQTYGSATNSQITGLINQVDGIYENQLDLRLLISFQSVWNTSNDPYTHTDSLDLLEQFRDYWRANRDDVGRDTAHLFTGKDLDENVVGRAYTGVICNNFNSSFGVSQDLAGSSMIKLVAHELGHNFNARHDDEVTPQADMCHLDQTNDGPIMCSRIQIFGPQSFSSRSRTDVRNHVNNNPGCLNVVPQFKANFTFSCFDSQLSCDFSDQSTAGGFPIVSYEWFFSDTPQTQTGKVVQHTFATSGTHQVELLVTDSSGATRTAQKTVDLDPNETCIICP